MKKNRIFGHGTSHRGRHLSHHDSRTTQRGPPPPHIVPPPHGPAAEEYPSAEGYSSAGGPQGCISPQVLTKAWRPPSERRQVVCSLPWWYKYLRSPLCLTQQLPRIESVWAFLLSHSWLGAGAHITEHKSIRAAFDNRLANTCQCLVMVVSNIYSWVKLVWYLY